MGTKIGLSVDLLSDTKPSYDHTVLAYCLGEEIDSGCCVDTTLRAKFSYMACFRGGLSTEEERGQSELQSFVILAAPKIRKYICV